MSNASEITFKKAFFPIAVLILLILLGLFIGPLFLDWKPFPLEFIFMMSSVVAVIHLKRLGIPWVEIQEAIVQKIAKAMPTLLILLAIGLIIGSWIVSGTIPMLVYYGIKMISPTYIYLIAFLVPVIFSTVTGTSWGSVATIGVVLMGVAATYEAHLAITAAAVIGGSFFGDKLSPLSDTTNVAALATEIEVHDHIRSMLVTTLPAAILAIIFFTVMCFVEPAGAVNQEPALLKQTIHQTKEAFNFNPLLMIPPLIVLYGSIKRLPTLQVLVISSLSAVVLAFCFQSFSMDVVLASMFTGFDAAVIETHLSDNVYQLYSRGGMYSLKEPLIISILVFVFVGTVEKINAMPIVVKKLFGWVKSDGGIVRSTLISTAVTNAMTSNQYATSFIVGDAFKKKYDEAGIERKVLSRSLEDTGTMLESIVPWHQTCIFVAATTGVAVADYWYWQVFSLSNIVLAFVFTVFGIGIFKVNDRQSTKKKS